jgi:Spy/CpxP family protein refolding chaperone
MDDRELQRELEEVERQLAIIHTLTAQAEHRLDQLKAKKGNPASTPPN